MAKENKNKTLSPRQKIRLILLILSFLLIPVTIFYISPIILMMGAAEGIVTGSLILYILLFFIALFAGRIWCGWLCPMGAWQEFWSPVIKRPVTAGWRDLVKYGIAMLMLIAIVSSFVAAGGIKGIDLFYGTVGGISISSLDVLQVVMMIFIMIPALAPSIGAGIIHVAGWQGVFVAFILFALIGTVWLGVRQAETLP